MSKCSLGGLHHPPLSLGSAKFGGQKLVAVIVMEAPQVAPLLKRAVLSAAVLMPYPLSFKFP
ncbi:hypothetical protein AMTR_s00045p00151360 [Amborella trichopoda]|uniref:Uncharacterized protein n=1 Tax=Amborella trichopoda TaxID=13333 RepID=W1P361_AMBTC|nr:hypothetical protein AMTR_s00045p00151360 [Amborella trichopoda]